MPAIRMRTIRQFTVFFTLCKQFRRMTYQDYPHITRYACSVSLSFCTLYAKPHSRPPRPRSLWSAPRIATLGQVQLDSGSDWLCKRNRMRPEPIRFVRLDSKHAQSDGKSVNRGLPVLEPARGRDLWCWPKGARPLGTRQVQPAYDRHCNLVKTTSFMYTYHWVHDPPHEP